MQSMLSTEKLSTLLQGWAEVPSHEDVSIEGVSEFSSDVTHGDLFLALVGTNNHGLNYCGQAISNGAAAIAWEPDCQHQEFAAELPIPAIKVENLSAHLGEIAQRCYGDINADIKTVAVTGTDGKSSVAYLTAQVLESQNKVCAMLGTLGYGRIDQLTESNHTTPPLSRIGKEFRKAVNSGCKYMSMEASSHGIAQDRLENLNIHTAVLTNISRDHLDYHASLQDYIDAKGKLFFSHHPTHAVLNLDDQVGRVWAKDLITRTNLITYSLKNKDADIFAANIQYLTTGVKFEIQLQGQVLSIEAPLFGEFNAYNLCAVIAILISLDFDIDMLPKYIAGAKAVPGRMQLLSQRNFRVIVDYAHTPNALSAAIQAVRQHFDGRLVCVFGCGGNRDQGKRKLMGEVADKYADYVVITSDNPRNENPQIIIDQVEQGFTSDNYISIADRKRAIEHAIELSKPGDVVLIAGKGHEKFQEIDDQLIEFDDVVIASQIMDELAHG